MRKMRDQNTRRTLPTSMSLTLKGQTLTDLTLSDLNKMDVAVWEQWYVENGKTQARSQGLLPFRVWEFFNDMVTQLRAGDMSKFICAPGIVSHFVGDACQPLHGSYFSDGYRDSADPHAKKWPGKGVHSTYEDKMVDRFSSQLLARIGPEAEAFTGPIPPISNGRDAALATMTLMSQVAAILPPRALCDEYIRLGGGSSVRDPRSHASCDISELRLCTIPHLRQKLGQFSDIHVLEEDG
jgi:hypothetical protein